MSQNTIKVLDEIILHRRTTKVPKMNGKEIESQTISDLLTLADNAPTHGRTEPWRFIVYSGEGFKKFCQDHGDMYWEHTSEETRNPATKDNLTHFAQHASHLIIAVMKRTPETKIPFLEEYAATSAAVQNILLGASVRNIAAIWNTGGMALKPPMKAYLGLDPEDEVVGLIYLGYSDDPIHGAAVRKIPLTDKVTFVDR